MNLVRHLVYSNRQWVVVLLVIALAMKAFFPSGYMLSTKSLVLDVTVCADSMGGHKTQKISIPMNEDGGQKSADADGKCAFSSLSSALAAAADPAWIAAALAFTLALAFSAPASPSLRSGDRLRPPLRGPPLAA